MSMRRVTYFDEDVLEDAFFDADEYARARGEVLVVESTHERTATMSVPEFVYRVARVYDVPVSLIA